MSGDRLAEHDATVRIGRASQKPALIERTPQPAVIYLMAVQHSKVPETGQQRIGALPAGKEDVPVAAMRCGLY